MLMYDHQCLLSVDHHKSCALHSNQDKSKIGQGSSWAKSELCGSSLHSGPSAPAEVKMLIIRHDALTRRGIHTPFLLHCCIHLLILHITPYPLPS